MRALVAAVLVLLAAGAAQAASCRDEVGAARAGRYVRQCLMVSPATHPPCNAQNPCALIRDEIRRGCLLLQGDPARPKFCRAYLARPG